jgi:hypothetical protein
LDIPHGIKAFVVLAPPSVPIPLRNMLKVSGVNDGILALRQWNNSVGLVKRLDNFVSCYTIFSHCATPVAW